MSNLMRLGLVAAAVAVLVAGFVLASSTSDDADDPERAATAIRTAATAPPQTTSATGTTPKPAPKPAAPAIKTVVVRDGAPQGGVQKLRFDKGERVRFRVRSDVKDHIHVHGYDTFKDVAAGGSASFSFPASIDGRFEVELEDRGVEIAQLEVQP